MPNHEEAIINYIENCDHSDDEKATFIDLLLALHGYCHEGFHNQLPKTLKQLFRTEIWENINENHRNTLGKHVRHLVKLGDLPLTDTGEKNGRNHRLYIINK